MTGMTGVNKQHMEHMEQEVVCNTHSSSPSPSPSPNMPPAYKEIIDLTDVTDSPTGASGGNAHRRPAPSQDTMLVPANFALLDYPASPSRGHATNNYYAPSSPLRPSAAINKQTIDITDSPQPSSQMSTYNDSTFGASLLNSRQKSSKNKASSTPRGRGSGSQYSQYIKPASGAFGTNNNNSDSPFNRQAHGYVDDWPAWVYKPQSQPLSQPQSQPLSSQPSMASSEMEDEPRRDDDDPGEDFDVDNVQLSAQDHVVHDGDADEQMRELLAGAIGDGEDEAGEEGDDAVEGFADDIRLMPHQIRGVRWMRERESGRKRGGILADDMGLGKTVQTLARIVEGRPTTSEKRLYKGGTLIVCPLAVMEQWATECRTKTQKGLLKVTTHHGPKRATTAKELEKFDVVITTFQVLASESPLEKKSKKTAKKTSAYDSDSEADDKPAPKRATKKNRALFDLRWHRVVIDEAQNIKNHNTQSAKAAVELKAKFRWCLTGTPIQNKVEELYSLFRFLRAKPLDNLKMFKERVSSEVQKGRTGIAMKRLHIILKAIMLRRTKDATINGKPILNLPARNVEIIQGTFDDEERAFYDAIEQKTESAFNKLAPATISSNYMSVLTLILRLRQACDHPSLVHKMVDIDRDALDAKVKDGDSDSDADDLADMLSGLGVGEKKCEICWEILQDQSAKQCIGCQKLAVAKSDKGAGRLPPSSSKIRMVLKLLADIDERSDATQKTIVFSQFTSFLDLLEPFLRHEDIRYVRYDGSLRADQREAVLSKIRTSQSTRVILISFKAGSTGLNLTCCNNVILTDMWWNPALEDQAFDRAHRLGQKLDVNIYKLTIEQTIEDRILELQNTKRELAQAALSGTGAKNLKLTVDDIMKLFQRNAQHDDEEDDDDY